MKVIIPFCLFVFFAIEIIAQDNTKNSSCVHKDIHLQNREHFTKAMLQLESENYLSQIEERVYALKPSYKNSICTFDEAVSLLSHSKFEEIAEYIDEHKVTKMEAKVFVDDICKFILTEIENETLLVSLLNQKNTNSSNNQRPAGDGGITVQAACTNVDFATGTTVGWTGAYGNGSGSQTSICTGGTFLGLCLGYTYYNNPNATGGFNTGPVNAGANAAGGGVHTIMTGGTDPNVPISVVPPGGGNSIRLGNGIANYKAQRLRQTFTVGAGNPNFVYQYAVVLDDEGHGVADQPYFRIRMYDQSNNLIDCATYDVDATSASSIPGFSFQPVSSSRTYKYKDWSTVTVPLAAYVGQNVTIEFVTSDCTQGAHFGYAYIQCLCSPIPIVSSIPVVCNGQTTTLTAPPGAASYSWSGPGIVSATNTQTALVNVGGSYTVTMGTFYSPPQVPCQFTQTISLGSAPSPATPSFTFVPVCLGIASTFTNNSSGSSILNYTWDFGDGTPPLTTSTLTHPVHTYISPSNYSVTLTVDNGCPASLTLPISISPQPTANFTVTNACFGTAASFTNISTAPNPATFTNQTWYFGDGNTTLGSDVNHTYTAPNTYSVKLVVVNNSSCMDSITRTVTIYPKPTVSFTTGAVCFNTVSSFSNSSSIAAPDNIASWTWDFDNNGTIDNTTQNPGYTYASPGTYVVKLIATSNNGCMDSTTVNAVVNALPTATFAPTNACLNANINLNNTSGIPLPDNIVDYSWNFGANASPSATSGIQNPPMLSYNTSGVKTITLNITANTSCTASVTQTVMVYPQPVANFSTTSVCQSTATAFTDLSSTAAGAITNWAWDYENNGSIDNTGSNPSFVYAASGTYTASLIVTDNNTCKDTIVLPIEVWGHSIPDFTPNAVCYGTVTSFTNLTNFTTNANVGGSPSYTWDFADGSVTSNAINPAHTYTLGTNANAVYNVTLTATTIHNCIDQLIKPVAVYALPTASLTSDSVCLGSPTHLFDASNGNGNALVNYEWDFLSNGSVDINGTPNPDFIFPGYGNNSLSYTVSTSPVTGLVCKNTTNNITVWVNPNPVPNFVFTNKCINEQPNGYDASLSNIAVGTNSAYAWGFGDGSNGSGITANHTYATAGVFNTTLTVTSNKGCQTSLVKQVEVYQKPIVVISSSNACDKKAMTFTATPQTGSGTVAFWNWDFNNTIVSAEATGQTVSYVFPSPGQQTVALVSITNNGCRDTITVIKYVDYVPVPLFSVDKPSGCPEHCVTFTDATAAITGPAQNVDWKWVLGDGTVIHASSGASQSHCYQNTSSNQLALFDVKLVVTTDRGCTDSLERTSFITVYPTPIAQYAVSPDPGSILTPLVYFQNESQDFTKWIWKFGDGSDSDSINLSPSHFYQSDNAGSYYSSLFVYNQYGCWDSTYVRVDINPEFTFYIPNAFSPENGDGINDFFTGYGIGIDKFEMWIFDRWGEKLFYTDDITKGWDGKAKGSEIKVKNDVYVWKVKIKDVLGKWHDYIGHVTVLK